MTVTQRVKNILSFSKEARNSDKSLYKLYLRKANQQLKLNLTDNQIDRLINELPSFETIRRTRQKLQELNPSLRADDVVRKLRSQKEMEMQQNTPTAKPERLEQILSDGSRHYVPQGYLIAEED